MKTIVLSVLFLTAVGCKSRRSTTQNLESSNSCQFQGGESLDDAIARIARKSCNTNLDVMFQAASCVRVASTAVAEVDMKKSPRKIDLFQCPDTPDDMILMSHPNELVVNNPSSGLLHFYKAENDNIVFQGNSLSPENPCRECHVSGNMIMKELFFPWRHWAGSNPTSAGDMEALGEASGGMPLQLLPPASMESFVRMSAEKVASGYKRGLREKIPELAQYTIQDLLKPIFCTTEINLLTDLDTSAGGSGSAVRNATLAGIFVDPMIIDPDGALDGVPGPSRQEIEDYFRENNIEGQLFTNAVPTLAAAVRITANALMRADAETGRAILQEGVVLSARYLDYPNPIFSKKRCGLIKYLPGDPIQNFTTAEAITEKMIEVLEKVDHQDVKEYVSFLKEATTSTTTETFKKRLHAKVDDLRKKCIAPASVMHDVASLYRLYRARLIPLLQKSALKYFDKLNMIEHFPNNPNSPSKVFPEYQAIMDGKYADDEGLGLTTECKLRL
ncbi:MAG: hypothetical protein AB7T49_17790 [Oligoflexales bacterium]